MKLFNNGIDLNWARKENNRRGCDSVFIKAAEDEYAALLKINKESAKLEAPLEENARPTKQSEQICSDCAVAHRCVLNKEVALIKGCVLIYE